MLFNSFAFALFLPVMLTVYWSLRAVSRRWALLAGSYLFYSWWDWRFTSLLVLSTGVDFFCGRAIETSTEPRSRRRFLLLSLATNLGVLGLFKYFNFFRDSVESVLAAVGMTSDIPALNVILPMGISFYTFQTMSYTIDVYRGGKAEQSLRDFAIFVACFPQLVAGPIMRARELLPQIKTEQRFRDTDMAEGVYRLFRGLFKKMVIADALAIYVDAAFGNPGEYRGLSAGIALYAYAFQIYMDFSGYTDIAIGVGRMLGLRLAENFDRPYLATSPRDFWRRWHISLSTWLRDYLYIPLGGSRNGKWLSVRNLFLTMALGGLWHGAAWTFVAWGLFHGCLLGGQRIVEGARDRYLPNARPLPRVVSVIVTFHLVCLGWLVFRAPDWQVAITLFVNLFDLSGAIQGKRFAVLILLCAVAHCMPIRDVLMRVYLPLPAMSRGALAAVTLWLVILLTPASNPFIYFQF